MSIFMTERVTGLAIDLVIDLLIDLATEHVTEPVTGLLTISDARPASPLTAA